MSGWADLPLSAAHADELRRAGIKFTVAKARGYATVDRLERFELRERFGFTGPQTGTGAFPALLVPMYGPGDPHPTYAQLKPAERRSKGRDREGPKYETPAGQGNRLDVNPLSHASLGDPARRLWIVEGAKKADALISLGEVAVAIAGVWNWRGKNTRGGRLELGDFERIAWNDRQVLVCFDSDVLTNGNVRSAMERLVGLCRARGAEALFVIVPGDPESKIGADDFLAAKGHGLADLLAVAVARLPEVESEATIVAEVIGRLEKLADGRVVYVAPWGRMLRYDAGDGVWKIDHAAPGSKVGMHAIAVGLEAIREGIDAGSVPESKWWDDGLAQTAVRKLCNAPGSPLVIDPDDIDAHPHLLNCANGVVDLRTGNIIPHDPGYLMMRSTGVRYTGPHQMTRDVEAILTCVDDDARPWLHRYFGMGAVGEVGDELLLVLLGEGSNGKTTLLESVGKALGSYADAVPAKLLTKGADSEHATIEADLAGMRLCWASETSSTATLDMERVKGLTGGDRRKARRLYENFWSFKPSHTLLLLTNHPPIVTRGDHGSWRRLRLLEFPHIYVDHPPVHANQRPKDGRLRLRLLHDVHNAEAMLSWIVEGAGYYLRTGLADLPESMDNATTGWRSSEDVIGSFVDECLAIETSGTLRAADVTARFTEFQIERGDMRPDGAGMDPRTLRRGIDSALRQRGGRPLTAKTAHRGARVWVGISWR